MNKLQGFLEIKRVGIPTVPLRWFDNSSPAELDSNKLWTIRTAVENGDDLNLPRAVGVTANEALTKAKNFLKVLGEKGSVIYYPYFIAEKSGVIEVSMTRFLIEAVRDDLWNLVSDGKRDVTICLEDNNSWVDGNVDLLLAEEIDELKYYAQKIRGKFRSTLAEGKSVMLEWSYSRTASINREPEGEKELVFYELRAI